MRQITSARVGSSRLTCWQRTPLRGLEQRLYGCPRQILSDCIGHVCVILHECVEINLRLRAEDVLDVESDNFDI